MNVIEKAAETAAKGLRNKEHFNLYANGFEAGAKWAIEMAASLFEIEPGKPLSPLSAGCAERIRGIKTVPAAEREIQQEKGSESK
jgi:hypothetical protein